MGIHLQGLATKTDTHGHYQRIGEVYGFPISIKSERTLGDGKENELKQHKSELVALDRKITTELAPKHDENDGTEVKQEQTQQSQTEVKAETTVNTVNVHTADHPQGHKPSMVAEPQPRYSMSASMPRFPARHSGI